MALSRAERQRLIDQHAAGPARLRAALATVPAEALKWRPAPNEWSAHEVVCHCADSETNSHARIRFVLSEKELVIQGYDQERWAREGRHRESGRYTAEDWLTIYADHLEIHARRSRRTSPRGAPRR